MAHFLTATNILKGVPRVERVTRRLHHVEGPNTTAKVADLAARAHQRKRCIHHLSGDDADRIGSGKPVENRCQFIILL
jgi:hypothetical protein